jgi:hypothetical protein
MREMVLRKRKSPSRKGPFEILGENIGRNDGRN